MDRRLLPQNAWHERARMRPDADAGRDAGGAAPKRTETAGGFVQRTESNFVLCVQTIVDRSVLAVATRPVPGVVRSESGTASHPEQRMPHH